MGKAKWYNSVTVLANVQAFTLFVILFHSLWLPWPQTLAIHIAAAVFVAANFRMQDINRDIDRWIGREEAIQQLESEAADGE